MPILLLKNPSNTRLFFSVLLVLILFEIFWFPVSLVSQLSGEAITLRTFKKQAMKRATPWIDDESDGTSSGDESSSPDNSSEDEKGPTKNSKSSLRVITSEVKSGKEKSKGIDFAALSRHGYKGGLSVLSVPPPKDPNDGKEVWSWSKGQESRVKEIEETFVERQKTRTAVVEGEQLVHAQTQKERKNVSYSQREKKKRDLGQSSRGKNYVEEEKRLLRDNGIYSGFDS